MARLRSSTPRWTATAGLLRMLVDGGANTGVALRAAAQKGNADMVADMLTRKLEPGALDKVLIDAAGGGHTTIVQSLLDKGANVNARWRDGRTALTLAAAEASVRDRTAVAGARRERRSDLRRPQDRVA